MPTQQEIDLSRLVTSGRGGSSTTVSQKTSLQIAIESIQSQMKIINQKIITLQQSLSGAPTLIRPVINKQIQDLVKQLQALQQRYLQLNNQVPQNAVKNQQQQITASQASNILGNTIFGIDKNVVYAGGTILGLLAIKKLLNKKRNGR